MKKNIVIGVVVGALVVGAGAFALSRDNNEPAQSSSSEQSSANSSTDQASFDPVSTNDTSFIATISSSDTQGKAFQATMEYDKETDSVKYTSTNEGQTLTIYYTTDAYYMCQSADNCIKYPLNGVGDSGFDRATYEYSAEEIAGFKETSSYQGQKDCSAGKCDIWKVSQDGYEATLYVDSSSKRIVEVETSSQTGTSKITYEYKDVNITPPANAQELPSLGQ